MKLSDGEKLILTMLCEIHEKLGIKDGIEPKFVKEAIYSGNLWGLRWQYPGVFDTEEKDRETVSEVGNILDMWYIMETTYAKLPNAEKDEIAASDAPFSDVRFRGFDGNSECDHISIASFLIDELDRFTHFKGRDLNSHMPVLDSYRRMYPLFEPMRRNLGNRDLTTAEIITLLQAAVHPSRRKS